MFNFPGEFIYMNEIIELHQPFTDGGMSIHTTDMYKESSDRHNQKNRL